MALLLRTIAGPTDDSARRAEADGPSTSTAGSPATAISRHDAVTPTRRPAHEGSTDARETTSRAVSGVRNAAVGVWNALIGDDLRTVADPHAPAAQRLRAGLDLALDVVPEGKELELGVKLAARAAETAAARVGVHAAAAETHAASVSAHAAAESPLFRGFAAEHLRTVDAAVPNAESVTRGFEPPWKAGSPVHDGRLLRDDHETFARVYREADDGSGTHALGPWLLRKSDLEGKSSREIKDAFALPQEPTHVADVHLNAGFRLRTGTSGPNTFGRGGAKQFQAISEFQEIHLGPARRLP